MYRFDRFFVQQGITVRFVGCRPAKVHVRGLTQIEHRELGFGDRAVDFQEIRQACLAEPEGRFGAVEHPLVAAQRSLGVLDRHRQAIEGRLSARAGRRDLPPYPFESRAGGGHARFGSRLLRSTTRQHG